MSIYVGKYEQAIQDYTKAIELKPTMATAYYHRGMIHDDFGKYEQAIQDYTKAIELRPAPIVYYRRALVYSYIKKYRQAIQDYEVILRTSPNFIQSRENLELIKKKLDQL